MIYNWWQLGLDHTFCYTVTCAICPIQIIFDWWKYFRKLKKIFFSPFFILKSCIWNWNWSSNFWTWQMAQPTVSLIVIFCNHLFLTKLNIEYVPNLYPEEYMLNSVWLRSRSHKSSRRLLFPFVLKLVSHEEIYVLLK